MHVSPQTKFLTLVLGYHVTTSLASVELFARLRVEMQILATSGHIATRALEGRGSYTEYHQLLQSSLLHSIV